MVIISQQRLSSKLWSTAYFDILFIRISNNVSSKLSFYLLDQTMQASLLSPHALMNRGHPWPHCCFLGQVLIDTDSCGPGRHERCRHELQFGDAVTQPLLGSCSICLNPCGYQFFPLHASTMRKKLFSSCQIYLTCWQMSWWSDNKCSSLHLLQCFAWLGYTVMSMNLVIFVRTHFVTLQWQGRYRT